MGIDTACTLGMCAERSAIANMITNGESRIVRLVCVMGDGRVGMPCGCLLYTSVSAEVDERALHELYLRPFEIAVKEGAPSTVMCSYNRINGVYASENRMLLTRCLLYTSRCV